jgi:hypothetical protein
MSPTQWISACAQRLSERWRTVEPAQLEEVAVDIWQNESLRGLPPDEAAVRWLSPIDAAGGESSADPST